jgi:putative hemolysin
MNKKILILTGIGLLLVLGLAFYFFGKNLAKEQLSQKPVEGPTPGIPNPASVFCKEHGGVLEIRKDKEGNERGFCIFDDGSECNEWDFYYGKCKKGEKFCKDLCGDGICQQMVCMAVGCPCAETKETCPIDCGGKTEIPCAKEGEKVNRNPLIGPTDKKCCQGLVEFRESKSYSICLKPTSEGIILESPKENEKVKSPLKIIGRARGNWFFEAEFTAELYDEDGNFLGRAILTAKDDWMTENFVPFEGVLEFSVPPKNFGKILFLSANPSGLPEYQKIFEMKVQFEKVQYQKVLLYCYNPEKDKDEAGNIKCSRDGLVAIERQIPVSQTPIKDTIELLLKGKENLTEEEIAQGITTEFPLDGFKLKSANLKDDGTLILEFEDPLNKTVGGACRVGILWFQIEATAKQFPQVKKVKFLPEELFQP